MFRQGSRGALAAAVLAIGLPASAWQEPRRPNVLVIIADDLGYGDIGVHGCTDIPTPHIDSLARDGVRCTNAYAAAPRCSPSRAGLLTGRYPHRYGCEVGAEGGLPLTETLLSARLASAGYATGLIGKWHLGMRPKDHPNARGFDEFFGFLGGASAYSPVGRKGIPDILRDNEPVAERAYLTDAFGREAVEFIGRHANEPFFLTLAFNAPHRPLEAPRERTARFTGIEPPGRRAYAAMVSAMDDAIGAVLGRLCEFDLEEETLVMFLSDNGALLGKRELGTCSNAPLRDQKGSTFEGGLRVPFLVRWKGTLPAGVTYDAPVSMLDVYPTALASAGIATRPEWELDGVDILPHLAGRTSAPPHDALYWRFAFPPSRAEMHRWAIRCGDWKLVHGPERDPATGEKTPAVTSLFDVTRDPGESMDRAGEMPEKARELEELWQRWSADMPPPVGGEKLDHEGDER